MKYISLLHLSGITLSLVRRIYQEGPHFFCMKRPSSSLSAHTTLPKWKRQRLDPEPSRETSVKYDIRLLQHNQWWSTASPWNQRLESVPLKIKQRSRPIRAEVCIDSIEFEITFREKRKKFIFFPPQCIKKISSFLSVFCLGMSRGVLGAQQWPQDREALEESAKTHTAARLRLRRPSSGFLWPSLSLCKKQCSPMMCYVKFPEAWFKWLDILHASLVILQCIAPKSTWTQHEKQM